jgi:hypothetical protein
MPKRKATKHAKREPSPAQNETPEREPEASCNNPEEEGAVDSEYEEKPDVNDGEPRKRRKAANAPDEPGKRVNGKKWTGAELETLLTAVLAGQARTRTGFDGAVPGRSGVQCYHAWRWVRG